MNNKTMTVAFTGSQRGATLIVSLVILAVITILGVASMRSSNLELKMAASARDRAVALQAAESALTSVERMLAGQVFPMSSFMPTCGGANANNCFTPACTGGFCFSGDLDGAVFRDECSLANIEDGQLVVRQHWRNEGLWNLDGDPRDDGFPGVVEVLPASTDDEGNRTPRDVRFMVEFLCFVPRSGEAISDPEHSRNSGVPLFQITVRAEGEAGRSTVMLQSVFRAAE